MICLLTLILYQNIDFLSRQKATINRIIKKIGQCAYGVRCLFGGNHKKNAKKPQSYKNSTKLAINRVASYNVIGALYCANKDYGD